MESGENDVFQKLPRNLVNKLMPFQKDGVKFAINKNGRCLIADEMGLGKTIQAISVAYYYRQEWPLLIIVPSSLRYSWIEEFEKWLPDIKPGEINLVQSGTDISDIDKSQITVTTFGLLSKGTSRILREALMSQDFKVVIVDESHYIRNSKTVSAKTVVPLIKKANRRILLSGTPALARPVELYPQIDAICPNEFGSWWTYTAHFCDAKVEWIGRIRKRNVNGASNLVELQQKLSNLLMIRREKSEVLTQLPPKQRQRVLFELKDSNLKKEIRQTFDELRPLLKRSTKDKFEVLTGAGEHDTKDTNTLSLIQRLYRLSGEAKIGPAKEYIEMLCDNPNLKFLVFAYHHNMMNGLSESLHDKNVKFIRIDGETPPSERPHLVHQFQSDPNTRVAVLSILAAGVGLTLTSATVVVFAEMYWTPGTMIQCEDRAHRIGQTSCVAIHYLVARDTMDEWVWSAVCKKTIVTSTTLTGKKRKLEALEGHKYQVDVLSNAEVWVPTSAPDNSHLTEYFETSLDTGQKSILSFFSPSSNPGRSQDTASQNSPSNYRSRFDKKLENMKNSKPPVMSLSAKSASDSCSIPPSKRMKLDSSPQSESESRSKPEESKVKSQGVIVIESDGEDFIDETKLKSSNKKKVKSSKKKLKGVDSSKKSPQHKNNLKVLFENAKTSESQDNTCSQQSSELAVTEDDNLDIDDNYKVKTKKKSQVWDCKACTYLNHSELAYCEMCETPRKDKSTPKLRSESSAPKADSSDNAEAVISVDETNRSTKSQNKHTRQKLKDMEIGNNNHLGEYIDDPSMNELGNNNDKNNRERLKEGDENHGLVDLDDKKDIDNNDDIDLVLDEEDPLADLESMDDIVKDDKCGNEASIVCDNGNDIIKILSDSEEGSPMKINDKNNYKVKIEKPVFGKKSTGLVSKYFGHDEVINLPVERNLDENSENDESHAMVSEISMKKTCKLGDTINDKEHSAITVKEHHTLVSAINDRENVSRVERRSDNDSSVDDKLDSDCKSDILPCSQGTPQSAKKYRFKSIKRDKDGKSPITKGLNLNLKSVDTKHMDKDLTLNKVREVPKSSKNGVEEMSVVDENHDLIKDNVSADKTSPNEVSHGTPSKDTPLDDKRSHDYLFSPSEMEDMVTEETESDAKESEQTKEVKVVDIDSLQVYPMFKYQCSKYTDRIYLLTKEEEPLNLNFIPSDVQFGNDDGLPDILYHPDNLRLVQRFVREWSSLTDTKKRIIIKSGQPFISPLQEYEKLRSCKTVNTQRHKSKSDTASMVHKKAAEINGTVRTISKHAPPTAAGGSADTGDSGAEGISQAVADDGTPLCLQCFQPYTSQLVTKSSIQDVENAWSTRFCSRKCSQEYWMVSNNDYIRDQVFEIEHGVCQMCQCDAHSLFRKIRDCQDHMKRAEIISGSKYRSLTVKVKQQMVRKPVAGQFWHVDHIRPVWEGGGQCDIDNLRTLCVICHQKVTASQATKRATVKKLGAAVNSGDISVFFQRN